VPSPTTRKKYVVKLLTLDVACIAISISFVELAPIATAFVPDSQYSLFVAVSVSNNVSTVSPSVPAPSA